MDLSMGALMVGLLVGSVGLGFFLYGKREMRIPQITFGAGLMALPYCVEGSWEVLGWACAAVVVFVGYLRLGR